MRGETGLEGVIDMHFHAGPDPQVSRYYDMCEAGNAAKSYGLGGLVFKSHSYDTSSAAAIVAAKVAPVLIAGGVTLNKSVGGLSTATVELAASLGARVVWMPTRDRPRIAVESDGHTPTPSLNAILEVIRDSQMVLATGHLPAEDVKIIARASIDMGIERILVTHALSRRVGPDLAIAEQIELASHGVYLEYCCSSTLPPNEVKMDGFVAAIREVGVEHIVLSSDLGKRSDGEPFGRYAAFLADLVRCGLEATMIRAMACENPRRLLGRG